MPSAATKTSNSLLTLIVLIGASLAYAHDVSRADQAFLAQQQGIHAAAYMYLGAKHMVTGYDHLLYLVGVLFFVGRPRDVMVYVSLFALGHSLTLLCGVLGQWHINSYLVDAVIGLSVAYKAFENMGGFRAFFGRWLDPRVAVFAFGLVHGLGLASKLQGLSLSADGLVANILAFNVGVELGQIAALVLLFSLISVYRRQSAFVRQAFRFNVALMAMGFLLCAYQLTAWWLQMPEVA